MSSEVKRYGPHSDIDLSAGMMEMDGGNYVTFSDHQAALASRDEKIRALDEWRRKYFPKHRPGCSIFAEVSGSRLGPLCSCGKDELEKLLEGE